MTAFAQRVRVAPAGLLAAAALLGSSGACNFSIPSETYLGYTRLISVQATVAEFGPLYPERALADGAAAEALPGDRLALTAVIVGVDGLALDAGDIDSLWFHCGTSFCPRTGGNRLDDAVLEVPCASLPVDDSDAICRLGEGDGRFEFEIPALTEFAAFNQKLGVYGVFAWDGESAENCWEARKRLDQEIERCAFVETTVRLGPEWLLQVHAHERGLETAVPFEQIPAAVYLQPVNRPPALRGIEVEVDGVASVFDLGEQPLPLAPIPVHPGARIELHIDYDEQLQLQQPVFVAKLVPTIDLEAEPSYVFVASTETLLNNLFTSNDLHVFTDPYVVAQDFSLFIDEAAEAGTSRVVLVLRDDRGGEDVVWLSFVH